MSQNGKGSAARPLAVNRAEFVRRWERTFGQAGEAETKADERAGGEKAVESLRVEEKAERKEGR